MGKLDEAENFLLELYKELQNKVVIEHEMNSRVLRLMSAINLQKGAVHLAKQNINPSIEILSNTKEASSDSPFFAHAFAVKGDIEYAKEHYNEALEYYFKAFNMYKKRYCENMQLDHISLLLCSIVSTYEKLGYKLKFLSYTQIHEAIFGYEHQRTKELFNRYIKLS